MQSYNRRKRTNEEEDDGIEATGSDNYLGFATSTKTVNRYTVPIDEPIREAQYYRQICHMIANAGENDYVEFEISSPGGYMNGLIALLTAMEKTEATTVSWINGECHSAASMLALNCDVVYVAPYSTMLVHFIRFGSSGKATDVVQHVSHVYETSESIFRNTYLHFLTEDEIKSCLSGKEMYLNSEEIQARLKKKFNALNSKTKPTKTKAKSKVKSEEITT